MLFFNILFAFMFLLLIGFLFIIIIVSIGGKKPYVNYADNFYRELSYLREDPLSNDEIINVVYFIEDLQKEFGDIIDIAFILNSILNNYEKISSLKASFLPQDTSLTLYINDDICLVSFCPNIFVMYKKQIGYNRVKPSLII